MLSSVTLYSSEAPSSVLAVAGLELYAEVPAATKGRGDEC